MNETGMLISDATIRMAERCGGSQYDINHFLKVWGYARTIGIAEKIDPTAEKILELSAIVHDIACPMLRAKYGNTNHRKQEEEGPPMVWEFYKDCGLPENELERICFLVGHHHTYTGVDGIDWQILLEADFLVNAGEKGLSASAIESMKERVFHTETGIRLLRNVYKLSPDKRENGAKKT